MKRSKMLITRPIYVFAVVFMLPIFIGTGYAQSATLGKSGLPLPRFVSLDSAKANMRVGPSKEHQILWLYQKRGLPLEIIQESDNWRKVRDPEGNEGWIFHSLLSGKRTAIIKPWEKDKEVGLTELRVDGDKSARLKAKMEPGVVAEVEGCEENWCHIQVDNMRGYVEKQVIWGVYPDELIEE